MKTLLEADSLTKHFPVRAGRLLRRTSLALHAVDAVSLAIEKGETLGLVGESGCGKSTLGRLLIRLLEATEGRIRLEGQDITDLGSGAMRDFRRSMQIVFQDPYGALNPRMSAEDILRSRC